ncbi:pyridoxamine 5'-phosphate oxidase family protein [Natronoglomus mannanivorans]|uniref:Pyridoxamine 5'-phosphate oxidase family protein n=1 Tax=Natronoglomus mannanivorans TaxID=2979990 RepID=A0AAP2Z1V2_9EURY|nr:pyridoxamine 5'-phosphate oxidase family protein [Halobacteria archaeon AArc-xg1-1]
MSQHDSTDDTGTRGRPHTEDSYGIPASSQGLLPWGFVEETLAADRSYWVTTVRPDGQPHVRPTWGVCVDGTFHCGGGEKTRWVRNLASDPAIVVHRESADEVVIVEGQARRIDEETAEADLLERLDAAYERKYGVDHGTPFFAVEPSVVFAWRDYPDDATRWEFELENGNGDEDDTEDT